MMPDSSYTLVQHCINTHEYLTIKIYDCYLLFHRMIIQHPKNCELGLGKTPNSISSWNRFSFIRVTTSYC
jgi:hypothetical protein